MIEPIIPHIKVTSTALGVREKPNGRPLPKPSSSLEELKQYLKRATAIDYAPDPVHALWEKLKIVIAENNILIYDDQVVHDWMCKIVKKQPKDMTWVWKSLTKPLKDLIKKNQSLSKVHYQHKHWQNGAYGWVGDIDIQNRYTKIIPEAVLTTAETILKNFEKNDPICLLVTDYEVIQPDPFLAVAIPEFPFLIIDFWDEPGFNPKAAETSSQKGLND